MQTLVGFVVFVILVAFGLYGLQAGGAVPQAMIILLSAGVGLAVWKAQENAKQAQALEGKLASDKQVLYKLYLDVLREVAEKGSKVDQRTSTAYLRKLRSFVFGSLLIASDEVIWAHDRFLNASRISDQMVLPAVADVILAMRRDTGESTTELQAIDVLATFIKAEDIDKLRPLCEQWAREKEKVWPSRRQAASRDSAPAKRR